MPFIRVDVAVKPPLEVCERAIIASTKISGIAEASFVLNTTNRLPHITLYSAEYPFGNLPKIMNTVSQIASCIEPFIAKPTLFTSHSGYIDIAFKDEGFRKLHRTIVEQLNPYRDNHLPGKYQSPKELDHYSSAQRENIKRYGYSEVFSTFRPHLTISRLADENQAKEIALGLNSEFQPFLATSLASYAMGDHNVCTAEIQEFHLK